jgi:hypothetical protein
MELTKNVKKHICDKCNFKCTRLCDFKAHLLTAKHNLEQTENVKNVKNVKSFTCDCGKTYKVSSGLWKHKKTCSLSRGRCPPSPQPQAELYSNSITIKENQEEKPSIMDFITQSKEIMDILVLQNKEMVLQNKEQALFIKEQGEEMKRLNKEHSDTIRELIPKIGSNNNNNVVTATTNNQFNIQSFLNEDCKEAINFSEFIDQMKISFTDLENQVETGYVKGITKLFLDNLQGLGMNKRPIHCSDKKRKTLYIKENNEWDKEGSHNILEKGIQEVTRKTMIALIDEKENRAEEYSDMDSEFSMKCINIQRNLTPVAPREASFGKVASNISDKTTIDENQKTI